MNDEKRQHLIDLQKFQKLVQADPKADEIRVNQHAGNVRYLPISFLQMSMDEIFFGLWEETAFEWRREGNELVGVLTVRFFHPVAQVWLTRIGVSATMIRLQKGAQPFEFDKKIYNALEMDAPHLKSDCFRNAVQSIGKAFGRDLNRQFTDFYKPLLHAQAIEAGAVTTAVQASNDMSRALLHYDEMYSRTRMDDQAGQAFALRLQSCETPGQVYALARELEEYIPDKDPAQQIKKFKNL